MKLAKNNGFTFIELIITVSIISVLASISLPFSKLMVQRTKELELHQNLSMIRNALDAYKLATIDGKILVSIDESGYPESLKMLVDGVEDVKSAVPRKIYFLRRIPRDPFADNTLSATETWGKRSYASSAENPKEGMDIFDVYSKSIKKGLNGIVYREW